MVIMKGKKAIFSFYLMINANNTQNFSINDQKMIILDI